MCLSNQPSKATEVFESGEQSMAGASGMAHQSVRIDRGIVLESAERNSVGKYEDDLLQKCQRIYRIRRLREKMFDGSDIFCDPAWDILLDLFIGHLQGRQTSVTSCGLAACAPITTALRWLTILERDGFVVREYDPADRRRMFVSLTEQAIANMVKVIEAF
jgi:hypothetical protein